MYTYDYIYFLNVYSVNIIDYIFFVFKHGERNVIKYDKIFI